MKRTVAREKYAINKVRKLEINLVKNVESNQTEENLLRISVLESQLKEKDNEIRQLETSIEYLEGLLNDN